MMRKSSTTHAMPTEILGDKNAPHVIKFEYCGGWGYRRQVMNAIAKIEDEYPKNKGVSFQYNLYKDKMTIGRFEVTLFVNSKDTSDNATGVKLHSKVETNTFIDKGFPEFLHKIDVALGIWGSKWVLSFG